MKDERFPWTRIAPGPEPRLSPDFASRAIEKAHTMRARKRRAKLGFGAALSLAAVVVTALLMRASAANQQASLGVAPSRAIPALYTITSSDESDSDMLAVLVPGARYAQKFDAYYGRAAWDTYASWDPDSYDSARTR
jgi:hypothetical protein